MAKEIKSRVWDKTEKKMIYIKIHWENNGMVVNGGGGNFSNDFEEDFMEYTGLLDKNGNEIYSGDILQFKVDDHVEIIDEIKWIDNGYWLKDNKFENFLPKKEYREVIGNKCENPKCKYKNPKRYEWASISRESLRDKNDYIQLCPSCHRRYDINKLTLKQLYEQDYKI